MFNDALPISLNIKKGHGDCRQLWCIVIGSYGVCRMFWGFCRHLGEMDCVSWCHLVIYGRIYDCSRDGRCQSVSPLSLNFVSSGCSAIPLGGPCLLSVGFLDSQRRTVIPWLVILHFFRFEFLGGLMCLDLLFSCPYEGSFPWGVTH